MRFSHVSVLTCIFLFSISALFAQDTANSGNKKQIETVSESMAVGINSGNFKNEKDKPGMRVITIVEDRDQKYMTSKVYILQHAKAADVRPFLSGAVRRANPLSNVQRLNYKAGGKQYIVANMPIFMVPYVDDMVKKLDRACDPKIDAKELNASTMLGNGITQYAYRPKYRMTQDILRIVRLLFAAREAAYFLDTASNLFYGKNSKSDNDDVSNYVKLLDRPVPQVELKVKMYELNETRLIELGIDYIRWKNGPGADILNIGADLMKFKTGSEFFGKAMDLIGRGNHTWTGFLVAPDFDASFIRLLAQNGTARVATSGVLTVANDYADPGLNYNNARYRISFTPQFQNISKNGEQEITLANDTPNNYRFFLRSPVICFKNDFDHQQSAIMTFGWSMTTSSVLDRDNNGQEGANTNTIQSFTTIAPGEEKIVATFKRRQKVNQNNGMPFLSDIPILKYIFGSTTDSYAYYRYFVTFETRPIAPRPDLSRWAGNIIDISSSFKDEDKIEGDAVKKPMVDTGEPVLKKVRGIEKVR